MRIESVISIRAEASVGPTRLDLLTASSAKRPAVVVATTSKGPDYYVFDVASLQSELSGALSATPVSDVLNLAEREPVPAVVKSDAASAPPGTPVEDNGRLIGVIALDVPDRPEPTEADMDRSSASSADAGAEGQPRKKGLWKRMTGSG